MNRPKISIITVSYNTEKTIEKTVQSVISQDYDNVEFIIIDGASADRTVDIIRKYEKDITYWISEPDMGVYDAMNKGIAKSSGDYINFMNAGDCFFDSDVLTKVIEKIGQNQTDIYYGNTVFVMPGNEMYCNSPMNREEVLRMALRKEMINHQSMFVKGSLLKKRGFATQYKIAADLEWLCYALDADYGFEKMELTICRYDQTGMSSKATHFCALKKEVENVLQSYPGLYQGVETDVIKDNEAYYFDLARKNQFIMNLLNQWLVLRQSGRSLIPWFEKHHYEKVVVYGMGMLGRRLIDELADSKIKIVYVIDQKAEQYTGAFPVYASCMENESVDVIVITAVTYYEELASALKTKVQCDIASLEDIFTEMF